MEKGSVGSAVLKSVILLVLGALVVLGIYFVFSRSRTTGSEESYEITVVDEITTTNLERTIRPVRARW